MLSSPRARPFAYIECRMRSSNALRWAQNTMRADRRTRIVREMVRPHHSVPFGFRNRPRSKISCRALLAARTSATG